MTFKFDEIQVEEEVQDIESSLPAILLQETTQVLVPKTGRNSIAKNRLTHSYEVSTSSKIMAAYIAKSYGVSLKDIDYNHCLKQISLLHDIGHAPFGHDGQEIIDEKFKEYGLEEGFSDNNNNLVIIEDHNIKLRDCVKAGIIKYPEKLYEKQKEKYGEILKNAIEEDKLHFAKLGIHLKNQKTTIACQIMDEADRNSYTCSDLADFFTLGNEVPIDELSECFNNKNPEELLLFKQLKKAIESKNNTEIRMFFNNLKKSFNANFELNENGIHHINSNLNNFRETLSKVSKKFFITPVRAEELHLNNMTMLNKIIEKTITEDYYTSNTYKEKIEKTDNKIDKLRAKRDMIASVSDWFVIKQNNKIKNTEENKIKIKRHRP